MCVHESWIAYVLLKLVALYTAGSGIALTGAVRLLIFPHAVTSGASLYIEQEKLRRPDLFSILAILLVFHTITLEFSHFRKIPTRFLTIVCHRDIYSTITYSRSEVLSNRRTHTQRTTTVSLTAHAHQGLNRESTVLTESVSLLPPKCCSSIYIYYFTNLNNLL